MPKRIFYGAAILIIAAFLLVAAMPSLALTTEEIKEQIKIVTAKIIELQQQQAAINNQPSTSTFSINLKKGWNFFSIPIQPTNSSTAAVLSGIAGKYTQVIGDDSNYDPLLPADVNSLNVIEPGNGYEIKMTEPAVLNISGSNLNHTAREWVSYLNLSTAEWSKIGLTNVNNKTVDIASSNIFSGVNYLITTYNPYETNSQILYYYSALNGRKDFSTFELGKGYWIKPITNKCTTDSACSGMASYCSTSYPLSKCDTASNKCYCASNTITTAACSDDDGGSYTKKGAVTETSIIGVDSVTHTDSCYSNMVLKEWSCDGNKAVLQWYNCPDGSYGCQDGACVMSDNNSANSSVELLKGWNFFSLPTKPINSFITSVLSNIAGKYNTVIGATTTYQPLLPDDVNSLKTIEASKGYDIEMKEAATLRFAGVSPNYSINQWVQSLNLKTGWNKIGVPLVRAIEAGAAPFGPYGFIAQTYDPYQTTQQNLTYFSGLNGKKDFSYFEPKKGYNVKVLEKCSTDANCPSASEFCLPAYPAIKCTASGSCSCFSLVQKTPPCANYGDVNSDSVITNADRDLVLSYLPGSTIFSTDQIKRADVSGDGIVGTYDSALILQLLEDKIGSFPVCQTPITCADSDANASEGKNYYLAGSIKVSSSSSSQSDVCVTGTQQLKEWFCDGNKEVYELFTCPYGCGNGACRKTPSITVVYPNGGEQLTANTTHILKWNVPDRNYKRFKADLISQTGLIVGIGLDLINDETRASEQSSVEWTPPSSLVGNYKLRVFLCPDVYCANTVSDQSDNFFSIASPPATPSSTFSINLQKGWNFFSIPIQPINSSTTAALSGIAGKYTQIIGGDSNYDPLLPADVNSLNTIEPGKGYEIKMKEPAVLNISGSNLNHTAREWITYLKLGTEWSKIGLTNMNNAAVDVATSNIFPSVNYLITTYNPYETNSQSLYYYSALNGKKDFSTFELGKGYWIKPIADKCITDSACSGLSSYCLASYPLSKCDTASNKCYCAANTITTTACSDDDGGLVYDKKGAVTETSSVGVTNVTHTDSCYSNMVLKEWYCDGNKAVLQWYNCPNGSYGCQDGACVTSPTSLQNAEDALANISNSISSLAEAIRILLGR